MCHDHPASRNRVQLEASCLVRCLREALLRAEVLHSMLSSGNSAPSSICFSLPLLTTGGSPAARQP